MNKKKLLEIANKVYEMYGEIYRPMIAIDFFKYAACFFFEEIVTLEELHHLTKWEMNGIYNILSEMLDDQEFTSKVCNYYNKLINS